MRTGAERMLEAAVASGIDVCFSNPGTTEMPLLGALDGSGMRGVLTLFEGVATGAADGYARIADRPAVTLLHLGPGLANGLANLHNARRAPSPVVNLVGDHPAWHIPADSPLTSDIDALAATVSTWVRTVADPAAMASDTVAAIEAALGPPQAVATLIVPSDCQWGDGGDSMLPSLRIRDPRPADDQVIGQAAAALRRGATSVLFVGGAAVEARGARAVARIRSATGCRVYTEMFCARADRGRHLPELRSLPYFAERALAVLDDVELLVTAGTPPPVAFFGSPDLDRSELTPPGCEIVPLAQPDEDVVAGLEALADLLSAPPLEVEPREAPDRPSGSDLTPATIGQAVAAMMPEDAIVVDEGVTSSFGYIVRASSCPPHTSLALPGGAIGMGLPVALGASIAAPDRRVIALQADGSAMYTNQALWSMAREGADVTIVLYSNHRYAILQHELGRAGFDRPGPTASALTDLSSPDIDFASIAAGMGITASRAHTTDEFVVTFESALRTPGPSLVEAVL